MGDDGNENEVAEDSCADAKVGAIDGDELEALDEVDDDVDDVSRAAAEAAVSDEVLLCSPLNGEVDRLVE